MKSLNGIVQVVTRREYLGFLLCWLIWFSAPLYETYSLYWALGVVISTWTGLALISKYGN